MKPHLAILLLTMFAFQAVGQFIRLGPAQPNGPEIYKAFNFYQADPRNGEVLIGYYEYDDVPNNCLGKRASIMYKDGMPTGPLKAWYCCGDKELYCEGKLDSARKTGEWKFYHKGNVLAEVGYYDPKLVTKLDTLMDGAGGPFALRYDMYGPDTSTGREVFTLDVLPYMGLVGGKEIGRSGTWKQYDPTGQLIATLIYSNGVLVERREE